MRIDRRTFGAGLASVAFAGLAGRAGAQGSRSEVAGYGPLVRDPAGLFDLPEGFSYRVISRAGEAMQDGFFVPDNFDGMGAIPLDAHRTALIRNHELKPETPGARRHQGDCGAGRAAGGAAAFREGQ